MRPAMAINKEIELRFVVGYTPLEFRDTLDMLAEGKVDAAPIVTGTVGLSGVDEAFDALGDPETQAKMLIDPQRPDDHARNLRSRRRDRGPLGQEARSAHERRRSPRAAA